MMKDINQILKKLFLVAVVFAGVSCSKESMDDGGGKLPPVPEGYVRASIATSVAENEQVQSRATDIEEKAYDDANVWVLMFNATSATDATPSTIVQAPIQATKSAGKLYALLRATAQPVTLYVVTGLTPTMNTYLGTPANFTEGTTTYAALSAVTQLQTVAVPVDGVPVGGTDYFPMCAERMFYNTGTTTLTEITANFRRIVAKIDIDASALNTADFTLESVTLANGAQKGFVLPQTTLPTNNGGTQVYTEKSTVVSNKILSQVYLYENNGTANPTKVIVKGSYKNGTSSYYRMDLHVENPAGSGVYVPYSMERNKCYTINITEMQNGGYGTLTEALDNNPSNAKYSVTVTDPNSHDVVSNGEYYLGVSNSEFIIYGNAQVTSKVALTLTHTADPAKVTTGKITASGTGLTLVADTPNGIAASGSLTLSRKTFDIKITATTAFTTGTLTIEIGNLKKVVKVERRPISPGGVIADFATDEYVMAEMASDYTSWLNFGRTTNGYDLPAKKRVEGLTSGAYIYHGLNASVPREASDIYVSRKNELGRIKVLVNQPVYSHGTTSSSRSYVGAFWRASQSGERLINNYAITLADAGAWRASVVWIDGGWSQGDIVLDAPASLPTYDAALSSTNGEGASWINSATAQTVSGTVAAGGNIHFCIGLKSTLPTATSNPRYAVVVLAYANGKKHQLIYLRQGEEADYLFRTTDPYGNSPAGVSGPTWRPDAQRFSPYNLTDPNMGTGGSELADHNQLDAVDAPAVKPSGFTQYPSQAGAYFLWATDAPNERRAFHPTNHVTTISPWPTSPSTFWDTLGATNETCPQSYRRPNDGITTATNTAGAVLGSEMRQSLHLKPNPSTGSTGTLDNSLWGYYADGFFDRRVIQNGLGSPSAANATVSFDTKDVAYVGRLFFNPASNASVFFSAAGYRTTDGVINYAGQMGAYWSSSAATEGWSFRFVNLGARPEFSDRTFASSVRCVRQ